jgi:hypothetical protein
MTRGTQGAKGWAGHPGQKKDKCESTGEPIDRQEKHDFTTASFFGRILGTHTDGNEEFHLLGYNAV